MEWLLLENEIPNSLDAHTAERVKNYWRMLPVDATYRNAASPVCKINGGYHAISLIYSIEYLDDRGRSATHASTDAELHPTLSTLPAPLPRQHSLCRGQCATAGAWYRLEGARWCRGGTTTAQRRDPPRCPSGGGGTEISTQHMVNDRKGSSVLMTQVDTEIHIGTEKAVFPLQ